MIDVNPLAHRYYLGDLERSARRRARPRAGRRATAEAAARAIEVARRLLHLGALGTRRA